MNRAADSAQIGTCGLDRLAHSLDLVRGQVVYNDDIARLELRCQNLLGPGAKGHAVHRPVEDARCDETTICQATEEGVVFQRP